MNTLSVLKQFIEPKSVALIGISRQTGEGAINILENLLSYGYSGSLYPINPNVSEILGVKTYASIAQVKKHVDLAVILTPRELVPKLVQGCIESDIRCVTIIAQGFNDAGDVRGKQLQKEIDAMIKNSQTRIIGPNTFGTANAYDNFNSAFMKMAMVRQPIGVICQTGMFFMSFLNRPLIGKGVDLGNACDIDAADCLDYFEQDADINVIALHFEGIKDVTKFMESARRVSRSKPIIALKAGKTERAAQAAQSHTGSLTGSDEVWNSAFRQAGIIRVNDVEEYLDLAHTFAALPLMRNNNIGIVTMSGGMGIVSLDSCQQYGLNVPDLSSETQNLLASLSPPYLHIGNPVDIWPAMMGSNDIIAQLRKSLEAVLSDNSIGAILCIGGALDSETAEHKYNFFNELALQYPDKPVTCSIQGSYSFEAINMLQNRGKVAAFPTPERAIRALGRLNQYSLFRRRL